MITYRVLVNSRNNSQYLDQCLSSIVSNGFKNIYYCDDCSNQSNFYIASRYTKNTIRNQNRIGSYASRMRLLNQFQFNQEDVIVLVDGDDYLFSGVKQILDDKCKNYQVVHGGIRPYHKGVFHKDYFDNLNQYYNSFITLKNNYHILRSISPAICALRTFRYSLYKKVKQLDKESSIGMNQKNQFIHSGSDYALMNPIMYCNGIENSYYIKQETYYYRIHDNMSSSKQISVKESFYLNRFSKLFPHK